MLKDAMGNELAINNDFGGTVNSQITYTPTSTGSYFLAVAGYLYSTGSYSLGATDITPAPGADIAGNAQTAAALAVGGSSSSTVGFAYDHDWFRIDLQAGHQYRFNAVGAQGLDTTLALRDAAGIQLAFNDDFGGTYNSQITYTATSTASYYLDVAGYGSLTGGYNLSSAVIA
jgi:hypothetical protein